MMKIIIETVKNHNTQKTARDGLRMHRCQLLSLREASSMRAVSPICGASPMRDAPHIRQAVRARQSGFTLIEVMLALLIFAFVAGIGAYALRIGVESRERLELAEKSTRQVDLMRTMIKRDLLQIAQRPVRDEFGIAQPHIFYGGDAHPNSLEQEGDVLLMSFARHGWVNPDAIEPRASLQYVQYIARDGALIRRVRPFLDNARGQEHAERVLYQGADLIEADFLRGEQRGELDWVRDWPSGNGEKIPRALQLRLNDARYGLVEYLFWIGEINA